MADKAAAIDQATKLGGRVIEPPRRTAGFAEEPPPGTRRPDDLDADGART